MGVPKSNWIDSKIIEKLKIERGIPIEGAAPKGLWADKVKQMKNGDSLLLPNANYADRFTSALHHYGFASKQKKQFDGKVRVWKMAKAASKSPLCY